MFIQDIKGHAHNVDFVKQLWLHDETVRGYYEDGTSFIMAEDNRVDADKRCAVLQEYLDNLVAMINIGKMKR